MTRQNNLSTALVFLIGQLQVQHQPKRVDFQKWSICRTCWIIYKLSLLIKVPWWHSVSWCGYSIKAQVSRRMKFSWGRGKISLFIACSLKVSRRSSAHPTIRRSSSTKVPRTRRIISPTWYWWITRSLGWTPVQTSVHSTITITAKICRLHY